MEKPAQKMMSAFLCFQNVIEKEELKLHLQASKDAQRQLTAEVLKTSITYILDKCLGWNTGERKQGEWKLLLFNYVGF